MSMADVKINQTGQLAEVDVTLSCSGDEALDTLTGAAISETIKMDQFATYGLKITVQLVKMPPDAPAPAQ
jgi:hypothetical protein